jgi:hypothetical protein
MNSLILSGTKWLVRPPGRDRSLRLLEGEMEPIERSLVAFLIFLWRSWYWLEERELPLGGEHRLAVDKMD